MKYGCIGQKLGHSFSRDIHAALGNPAYELCEIAPEDLDTFMKKREFSAINVTIPYKEAVLPYLTETDEGARRIGAVNTVVNRGGNLYGYNTDFYGMRALFRKAWISVAGKKTFILGTGGTSGGAGGRGRSRMKNCMPPTRTPKFSSTRHPSVCIRMRGISPRTSPASRIFRV